MTFALLFSGQGSQHGATMPWLEDCPEAEKTLREMACMLGPAWRARLGDPAWASTNRVAQVLITGLGVAAWQCLSRRLPTPNVIAGYSVGELPAFHAAGVYGAATALQLAQARAAAMDRVADGRRMGLMAVHGTGIEPLVKLCERHDLSMAIRQCAETIIVGGLEASLAMASAELLAQGYRTSRLMITVASHTTWMADAAASFGHTLSATRLASPNAKVVCNLTAAVTRSTQELAANLAAQIASPIHWDSCCDAVAERGVTCVLEVGPGTALSSIWRSRHPNVPVRAVDDFRSPESIAAWVAKTLA